MTSAEGAASYTRPVGMETVEAVPPELGVPPVPARETGPVAGWRRTFVALEERDFRIFWLGQLVSVTGTWMQTVAQGWLILVLTGSPFVLGVAAAEAARSIRAT